MLASGSADTAAYKNEQTRRWVGEGEQKREASATFAAQVTLVVITRCVGPSRRIQLRIQGHSPSFAIGGQRSRLHPPLIGPPSLQRLDGPKALRSLRPQRPATRGWTYNIR